MVQSKTFSITNPATLVPINLSTGFEILDIRSIDLSGGVSASWIFGMIDDSYIDSATGLVVDTNGFTPLMQEATYGADISGFTNLNPGVITVNDTTTFGFAIGDTIKVAELADDLSTLNSLNGFFTIASFDDTTITLVENTTAFSVWVSGGKVTRVSDIDGFAIPTENFAILGMTLGTSALGTLSEQTTVIAYGN